MSELKLIKGFDENKKVYEIFEGADFEWAIRQGFEKTEVEQAYDGSWYLAGYCPEKSQSKKEEEVRNIRNQYLEKYVDPYQMVLRWNTLTEENQNNIINYRQYLLDYTISSDKWFEQNPLTYDEWLAIQ